MHTLRKQSLRIVLEHADNDFLSEVFGQLSYTQLSRLEDLIKSSRQKHHRYILLRKNCELTEVSQIPEPIREFLSRYRPVTGLGEADRTDPVFVLACALLDTSNTFFIEKLKRPLNVTRHIQWNSNYDEDDSDDLNYRRYNDAWDMDLSTGYETLAKLPKYRRRSNQDWQELRARSDTLFADITQYAQEKNLTLQMQKVKILPLTGPYRVKD